MLTCATLGASPKGKPAGWHASSASDVRSGSASDLKGAKSPISWLASPSQWITGPGNADRQLTTHSLADWWRLHPGHDLDRNWALAAGLLPAGSPGEPFQQDVLILETGARQNTV